MSDSGHHGGNGISTPLLWLAMLVVIGATAFMAVSFNARLASVEDDLFICIEVEPVGTAANTFLCRPVHEVEPNGR